MSSVDTAGAVRRLRLFNEKAAELQNSRFTKKLSEGFTQIELGFDEQGMPTQTYTGPEYESEVKEFTLTYRMFVQPRDQITIPQIDELYQSLPVDHELKRRVAEIRRDYDDRMDKRGAIQGVGEDGNNTQPVVGRIIQDVFMYGDLAHMNEQQRVIFEDWRSNRESFQMLQDEWYALAYYVTGLISQLRDVNRGAIQQLITSGPS